jgi:hypothetical protein
VSVADGIVASFQHVAGTGAIAKYGGGRLRITGNSAPAGSASVSVQEGSLEIDGTYQVVPYVFQGGGSFQDGLFIRGPGAATLLGTGTVLGTVETSIAPGIDAPGQLTVGTISASTGSIQIQLAGNDPADEYDRLVVLNASRLTGRSLDIDLLNGFTPTLGDQFTIIDDRFAGAVSGTFLNLPQDSIFFADGRAFQISYTGGDGNDVLLTTVVPEPGSIALVVLILPVLDRTARGRRRRTKQCAGGIK